MKIRKMLLLSKAISVSYSFSVSIENHPCMNIYYICYVILAMYMLDSDLEPSYNFSKYLLLLPRILKLIEDMADDSTPLIRSFAALMKIYICKYIN